MVATTTDREPLHEAATPLFEDVAARVVIAVALSGVVLAALVALPLAAYPALIKFFPTTLATLAVPFRLAKALEFAYAAVAFGVLLPGGVWLAGRYVAALKARRLDPMLVGLADGGALLGLVVIAKVVMAHAPRIGDPGREHWVRPLAWIVLAALVLLVLANVAVLRRPRRLAGATVARPARLLAALVVLLPLCFMPSSVFVPSRGLAAAGIAAGALLAAVGLARAGTRVRPGWAVAGLGVLALVLLTWDLRFERGTSLIRQAHWRTVYLGPANSVLHGGTMLVDVFAQYGPGTTYFLAGFFQLVPISFGHFWVLTQVLDVVLFVSLYAIFRVAGLGALAGLGGALLALVTGVMANPMRDTLVPERPLRILLPVILVLLVAVAERRPDRRGLWSWLIAIGLAVCSIWAVEVFVYALAVVVLAVVCRARLDAGPDRALRFDRGEVGRLAGSVLAAQLVFAVATRAASGAWPDWPRYLEYTHVYASGVGSQPFAPFQPGLLLGLFYFASSATLICLLATAQGFMERQRLLAVSLAAATGLALGYFSYYAGESQVTNTYKMAPAAVLLGVLWLALAARAGGRSARTLGLAVAFAGLWAAAVGLTAYPSNVVRHFEHSALLSSPAATWRDLRFVARSPVIDPRAAAASTLVRRAMPGREHVFVLLPQELTTEVLLRTNRVELIPMSDPYGENFLPSRVSYLERVSAQLPVGTEFLTNAEVVAQSRSQAISDLDALLVRKLRQTFGLRLVRKGPEGLLLYRLAGRRA